MKLFEPITIRGMTLRNRILMSSMGLGLGYTNNRVMNFYIERARGGVGAIILGAGIPDIFFNDDAWGKAGAVNKFIERLKGITREIRMTGAKVGIQFYYGNRYPFTLDPKIGELVAPSARTEPYPTRSAWVDPGDRLREITTGEIRSIVESFGKAAEGAIKAGFDFVEIHNAHGLLPCQFFSPINNHRTDDYGGDLHRRMRFGVECTRAMRAAIGDDIPLFARHGAMDIPPGGFGVEDSIAYAEKMISAGIDVLNVSLGTPPFQAGYIPAGEDPEGTHVHLAAAIKARVNVPVVAVGRIKTPSFAESLLKQGYADIIAIGRQLIADPCWPEKASEGRTDEIIPCIDCHECYRRITAGNGVECTVNYCVSREAECIIEKAKPSKRVLVVGGGPAGMEAARTAGARGHHVTLYEKGGQLGGLMLLQAMIPAKGQVENFTRYLKNSLKASGVKVLLKKEVTPDLIHQQQPDVVILATGDNRRMPDVPGSNFENVLNGNVLRKIMCGGSRMAEMKIRSGWRRILIGLGSVILNRPLPLSMRNRLADVGIPIVFGRRVVVMGSDLTACQLADFLSEKGRNVILVAAETELAEDLPTTLQMRLLGRLQQKRVSIIAGVRKYERITGAELIIQDQNGEQKAVPGDTFISMMSAPGMTAERDSFTTSAPEVYKVGDLAEPLKLFHAIHDGAQLSRRI